MELLLLSMEMYLNTCCKRMRNYGWDNFILSSDAILLARKV